MLSQGAHTDRVGVCGWGGGEGSALRLFDTGVWCLAKVPIQTRWVCVGGGGGGEGVRGLLCIMCV